MHRLHLALQRGQVFARQQRQHAARHLAPVLAGQEQAFGRAVGVAQRDAHQKAVELRFGQQIGANLVVRVLRGDDEEGLGQGAGFAFHADLLFLHGFEQCALRAGAGAVDLVGQQHLGKDRAGVKDKSFAAALVHRDAYQIAGHQVGGELYARKLQSEGVRQGVSQRRLADAGHVFDEQMAAGEQAGHTVLHAGLFAHNHRVKLIKNRLNFGLRLHPVTLSEKPPQTRAGRQNYGQDGLFHPP